MTEHTSTAATAAPEWHRRGEPYYDPNPTDDGGLTVFAGVTALLFGAGGFTDEGSRWLFIISAAALVVFTFAIRRWTRSTARDRKRIEEGRAEVLSYRDDVRGWMLTDYGIAVGEPQARKLLRGEVVATDGPNAATISLIESASGRLAVVDENRKPLQPVTTR